MALVATENVLVTLAAISAGDFGRCGSTRSADRALAVNGFSSGIFCSTPAQGIRSGNACCWRQLGQDECSGQWDCCFFGYTFCRYLRDTLADQEVGAAYWRSPRNCVL